MKAIAILVLAVALEAGFLFSAALPAPALARAEAAVKGKVVQLAHAALPEPARARKS
jgi:hypothetical protein